METNDVNLLTLINYLYSIDRDIHQKIELNFLLVAFNLLFLFIFNGNFLICVNKQSFDLFARKSNNHCYLTIL